MSYLQKKLQGLRNAVLTEENEKNAEQQETDTANNDENDQDEELN